ncbi:MAG: cytochrome b/b6 domain-containing protein [Sphingomonadales bacterium]|nr:cytochrome b/b6 domain-containing protein [Sphingomonadales bacterium]
MKLTHWGVVAAVIANALFTREGGATHVWVGYALAGLLSLRLLWGVIGPAEARFSAFPPSPRRALAHLREIAAGKATAHASHNPLGALMVYAIWGTLSVIIATGIAMAGLPDTGGRAERPGHHAAAPSAAEGRERDDDDRRPSAGMPETRSEAESEAGEAEAEGPLGEAHEIAVNLLYLLIALHLAGVVFETRRSGREILLAMSPGRR